MKCPQCGNEAQEDAVFCDQCGQRLVVLEAPASATDQPAPAAPLMAAVAEEGVCATCGARNTPGEAFCDECGAPLEAPQPSAVPAAPMAARPQPAPPTGIGQASCPACGARLEPGDIYCFACGATLGSEAIAPASQPAEASTVGSAPAPSAADECPSCGAKVKPGDAFCDYCGAALASAAAPASRAAAAIAAPGGPRLLVGAANDEIALPEGVEVLLGREDPVASVFPDVDLTPYGAEEAGVSRRHCKITLAEGQYAIQDLGSTNGTLVNRTRVQPGVPTALHNGDEIRVGRLRLIFRVGA